MVMATAGPANLNCRWVKRVPEQESQPVRQASVPTILVQHGTQKRPPHMLRLLAAPRQILVS